MVWSTLAEGVGEAPFSSLLTLYVFFLQLMWDEKGGSWILSASVCCGCVSIAKASAKLHFYGGEQVEWKSYMLVFLQKLSNTVCQILSYSLFAFLTHSSRRDASSPLLWVFLFAEFAMNYGSLRAASLQIPIPVLCIFAVTMVIGGPPGFLASLDRIRVSHALQHLVLVCLMVAVVANEIDVMRDERARLLYEHLPHVLIAWMVSVPVSFVCSVCAPISSAVLSVQERAEKSQERLARAVVSEDPIMCRLMVDVEMADARKILTDVLKSTVKMTFLETGRHKEEWKWSGAAVVGTKVVFCPLCASEIMVLDLANMSHSFLEVPGANGWQWSGAVAFQHKVIFSPLNSDYILILDMATMTQSQVITGRNTGGKWSSLVVIGNKIVFCPQDASDIMILDMATMDLSFIDTGKHDNYKWSSAVAVGNKVVFCPNNHPDIMILDIATTIPEFLATGKHSEWKWAGTVAVDTKVVFCPSTVSEIMILDVVTMTLSFIETNRHVGAKWEGAVALANYVIFCPSGASEIMVLDMVTMIPYFLETGKNEDKKWVAAVAVENKIICCPSRSSEIMILDFDPEKLSASRKFTLDHSLV